MALLFSALLPHLLQKLRCSRTTIVEENTPLHLEIQEIPEIGPERTPPLSEQDSFHLSRRKEPEMRPSAVPVRYGPRSPPQESAHAVQGICGAFKGKKSPRNSLKSIQETTLNYDILYLQLELGYELRAKCFICIFEDADKSHFVSNVREEMSFDEIENTMRPELERDARRLQIPTILGVSRVEASISQNEEVLNDSDGQNWLVKRINRFSPEMARGILLKGEQDSVIWRCYYGKTMGHSGYFSKISTSKLPFHGFISALREVF